MTSLKTLARAPGRGGISGRASRRLALPVLLALLAAGCSQLSVSERSAACGTTDWYSYGLTDGQLGVPETERADLIAQCSEVGQPVDLAAYRSGHTAGLEEYCDAETGYEAGREGRRYRDVCTGAAEVAFLQGYEQGRASRPRYGTGPRIGLGLGIGSGNGWGGVGLGFPFYSSRHRVGMPYMHDYCFYNRPYCRAVGWY